jgi:putative addiction module component (TIGR02574 family)
MPHDAPSHSQPVDLAALSPVERMALADVLYDSAMREIDAAAASPEEAAEIDRRIARLESGEDQLVSWDEVYSRLTRAR